MFGAGPAGWIKYTIEVPDGGSVSARIEFSHTEGDVDLTLSCDGWSLDTSESTSDQEQVLGSGEGTYTVRVYGYSGAAAGYTMTVMVN